MALRTERVGRRWLSSLVDVLLGSNLMRLVCGGEYVNAQWCWMVLVCSNGQVGWRGPDKETARSVGAA